MAPTPSIPSAPQPLLMSPTASFPTLGPLVTRLVALGMLSRPLLVTSLQRETHTLSNNAGTLSLGAFPFGLTEDELTWVPVRRYKANEGGLPPSSDAPGEVRALWINRGKVSHTEHSGLPSRLGGVPR